MLDRLKDSFKKTSPPAGSRFRIISSEATVWDQTIHNAEIFSSTIRSSLENEMRLAIKQFATKGKVVSVSTTSLVESGYTRKILVTVITEN